MLGDRAYEGQQPPSNPEERKGLKETQFTAQEHSAAHAYPHEPAGQSPLHSRAPRRDPRQAPRISASLEGSEPTLERSGRLRLTRGHPSTERTNGHPLARPPYGGIKCQPLRRSSRIRWRQASTPHSGCVQGLICQLRSLLRTSPALWRHCGNM